MHLAFLRMLSGTVIVQFSMSVGCNAECSGIGRRRNISMRWGVQGVVLRLSGISESVAKRMPPEGKGIGHFAVMVVGGGAQAVRHTAYPCMSISVTRGVLTHLTTHFAPHCPIFSPVRKNPVHKWTIDPQTSRQRGDHIKI